MKKLPKSLAKSYRMLRLYLDDIEAILSIFQTANLDVEIEVGRFELDGSHELEQIGLSRTTKWDISGTRKGRPASVELSASGPPLNPTLSISDSDDTELMGLLSRVDAILRPRQSKKRYFCNWQVGFGALLLLSFAAGVLTKAGLWLPAVVAVFLFFTYLVVAGSLLAIYLVKGNSFITLAHRKHNPSFFQRNKDKLLLLILGAAIGTIIGAFGTFITQWVIRKCF